MTSGTELIPLHQAELHNWMRVGMFLIGQIYADGKGRFADGTDIHTSNIVQIEGDLAHTKNTTYKLVNEYKGKAKYPPLTQEQVENLVRTAPERHRAMIERLDKDEAFQAMIRGEPHPAIERRRIIIEDYKKLIGETE